MNVPITPTGLPVSVEHGPDPAALRGGVSFDKEAIQKLVDDRLKDLARQVKHYVMAFLGGFVLLAAIGIGFKEIIVTPALQWGYPPSVIQEALAKIAPPHDDASVTKAVEDNMFLFLKDHVDSGYSKVMVFNPSTKTDDNYILFYATEGQAVDLTITVQTEDRHFTYAATVDQSPIDENPTNHTLGPHDLVENAPVTKKLKFGVIAGGQGPNLHVLKVFPTTPPTSEVIFNCVVLVKNTKAG